MPAGHSCADAQKGARIVGLGDERRNHPVERSPPDNTPIGCAGLLLGADYENPYCQPSPWRLWLRTVTASPLPPVSASVGLCCGSRVRGA